MAIKWQSNSFLEVQTGDFHQLQLVPGPEVTCIAPLWTTVYIWEARHSLHCFSHLVLIVPSSQLQD